MTSFSGWVDEVIRHAYKFGDGFPRIAQDTRWVGSVTGGEAWGIRVRRKRGSHIRGSGEHRAFRVPMNENRTLWTLNF